MMTMAPPPVMINPMMPNQMMMGNPMMGNPMMGNPMMGNPMMGGVTTTTYQQQPMQMGYAQPMQPMMTTTYNNGFQQPPAYF